jgi:hypothetical protein
MPHTSATLRMADVLGALSLATDLANGQAAEQGLRIALLASRLAAGEAPQQRRANTRATTGTPATSTPSRPATASRAGSSSAAGTAGRSRACRRAAARSRSPASVLRFDGARCVERWSQADFLGLVQQIGALPAQAPPERAGVAVA